MARAGDRDGVRPPVAAGSPDTPSSPVDLPKYVLITPARNEAQYIELTLKSVVGQEVLPIRWVVVSDGSTDGTDEIIARYAAQHRWIEVLRMPERRERHFAGKVSAFNAGYERVRGLEYDVIGSLDADLSFESSYFSFLLAKFGTDSRLGVVGTPFREGSRQYDYRFTSIEHVSGACQLFRRECFEEIGGYKPISRGGIDLVAVTTARMLGWRTRTFPEKVSIHHRAMGTGTTPSLFLSFRYGKQDYYLGGHPLWEIFRSVYQMRFRPYVLGGAMLYLGYVWACLSGVEKAVPIELVKFRRKEQMLRLRQRIGGG